MMVLLHVCMSLVDADTMCIFVNICNELPVHPASSSVHKESPQGAASGLSRCNFFRLHKSSVHNYSTYKMLLHICSKNVVFLNEICSKYVVS